MYGKRHQGHHVTPLDSVSKAIRSQMQEKNQKKTQKIEDFSRIWLFFTLLLSLKSIFEEKRLNKSNFDKFYKKNGKKSRKKFGLAFDSGLKLICDAPRKKSPKHSLVSTRFDLNPFVYGSCRRELWQTETNWDKPAMVDADVETMHVTICDNARWGHSC